MTKQEFLLDCESAFDSFCASCNQTPETQVIYLGGKLGHVVSSDGFLASREVKRAAIREIEFLLKKLS